MTLTRFLLLVLCCAFAAPLMAQGDGAAGKIKVYTCTGCHGIPNYENTYPRYHVPKIGGQTYEYLVTVLNQYRSGERKHPTMNAQAEALNDQDIADIARFVADWNDTGAAK